MATTYPSYGQGPQDPWNAYPPPLNNNNYDTNASQYAYHKNDESLSRPPREISRTPSPTPSEQKELESGALNWKAMRDWRFWFRKEWIWYYIILVVILVLVGLMTIYHKQIVAWLTPVTNWMHSIKFGWLIPIGVLFVISFPPLFGHEIVAVLCGLVWGIGYGFAIVAAGTFLGEVGNFYAFKYCCRARGEKMERTNINYACLAKVVRDGGFKIALIARLSAIPGHFTTAIFSTCGMNIFVFSLAAILSLPKQFITVYLGVILEQSGTTGPPDTKSRLISDSVLGVSILITILAMWYIIRVMGKAKPQVIYERRKARQAKLARSDFNYQNSSETALALNPNASNSDIPLSNQRHQPYPFSREYQYGQQHDIVFAPKPSRVHQGTYGYTKEDDNASDESGSSIGYPTGPQRGYALPRQSTEVVEWDTGRYGRYTPQHHYDAPPGVNTQRTASPQNYDRQQSLYQTSQHPTSHYARQTSPPPQHQQSQYPMHSHPSANTPTQANFTQHNHNLPPSDPLPSPSYPADFATPVASVPSGTSYFTPPSSNQPPPPTQEVRHLAEPTGLSYHTAMGSTSREPSEASSDGGYIPGSFESFGKPS